MQENIDHTKDMLPNRQHVATQGMLCPYCRSSEIFQETIVRLSSHVRIEYHCHICKRPFTNIYKLIGYDDQGIESPV